MDTQHNYIVSSFNKLFFVMLSNDVVKATRSSIFVDSYTPNYQNLSTISLEILPQGLLVYQATIVVDKLRMLGFIR